MRKHVNRKYQNDPSQIGQPMLANLLTTGRCVWVDPNITEQHFPISAETRDARRRVRWIHPVRALTYVDALDMMDALSVRPANAWELIAALRVDPIVFERRRFPIVALGQSWRSDSGNEFVTSFVCHGYENAIALDWIGARWHPTYRFAVVAK
jgi:hypothetical protein